MFSLANVKARTYEMEDPDTGMPLYIKPPKLATLHRFNEVFSDPKSSPGQAAESIAEVLNRNTNGKKVTADMVAEWMDYDQMMDFIGDFLGWLNKEKKDDPN